MDTSIIYPNFNRLKILTRWAGFIGVVQSLIWLGLSIVGIINFYYCLVDYKNEELNYGTIIQIIFYKLYFYGDVDNLPLTIDIKILSNDDVQTTLNPNQINIWVWVYLVSSIVWFFSSLSLILKIKKQHLRLVNTLLYIWIFITLYTSGMDLALSIIFGLDFHRFYTKSYDLTNDSIDNINLLAAKDSSISMTIIAARGFILWFINVAFMAYFFNETFAISEAILGENSFVNRDFMSDTHSITNRSPINAYDTKNNVVLSKGHQNKQHSLKLNTAPIERASRMSNSVFENRNINGKLNRGFSSFEQYPRNNENEPRYPDPDYTPPMPRANPFAMPPLRSSGSQSFKNKRYF